MIKLFTLFNLAGLFLFNLFFVDDVRLSQDLPARMEPGTEVRVTVTVNKAQINGFAKLQIDLPPGLSATAIDTRGASFTFADGKAKFIWMALPTQASFKVSYTLTADAQASGTHAVVARLSYIENNERKTADAPTATITIGEGAVASNEPTPVQPATEEEDVWTETPAHANDLASASSASIIPDTPVTDTPGLPAQAGAGNVTASRTVTQVSPNELLVEVTIQKGALRGFGKLQENLPIGFSAIEKINDDAIFSMTGRMLKYVWLNLPSKSELKVSYRLLAPVDASGAYTVNGEFGYLLNDLTQRAVVGSTNFTLKADFDLAQNEPVTTAPATTTTTTAAPATSTTTAPATTTASSGTATTQPTTPVTPPTATASSSTHTPQITTTPAPETGITYKVQITAAHREVGKPYFMERHNFHGDFSIEHHEGWIKYVTGSFDRYRSARDQRQAYVDAQYNFPGPFVTAYNNGERITVQEALMVSKQQWAQ